MLTSFAFLAITALTGEPHPYRARLELSNNSPDDGFLDDSFGVGVGFTYVRERWGIDLAKDFERSFSDTDSHNTDVEADLEMWRLGLDFRPNDWLGLSAGVVFSDIGIELTPGFCPPDLECTIDYSDSGTGYYFEARAYPIRYLAAYGRLADTGVVGTDLSDIEELSLGIRIEIRF